MRKPALTAAFTLCFVCFGSWLLGRWRNWHLSSAERKQAILAFSRVETIYDFQLEDKQVYLREDIKAREEVAQARVLASSKKDRELAKQLEGMLSAAHSLHDSIALEISIENTTGRSASSAYTEADNQRDRDSYSKARAAVEAVLNQD